MTDSNRLRMTVVRETSLGVTPVTPRMRTARITGESLKFEPQFVQSEELRDDRMNADPIKINENNSGGVNYEFSFPVDETPLSEWLRSMMFNPWVNMPFRANDGVADSIITGVAATGGVVTVTAGDAFVAGHLVRLTGFGQAGNNGLFKLTTGSATVPAVGNTFLTDEAVPPATARMKVVGFEGASADIAAVVDGLTSTTLDFTTLGLQIGQWAKIGGAGAAYRFATAANNGFARIVGIAANKLTLDNLPVSWVADVGTGKTIRVFVGDFIKNGVTMTSHTIERGFLGQAVPTYIKQRGMVVSQGNVNVTTEQIISGDFTFQGMTGEQDTVSLDATPDPATSNAVMAANVNVGRISESGVAVLSPNYVRSLQLSINNNLRMKTAAGDKPGAVDIGVGEMSIDVTLETYFGNSALLTKLLAGTPSNINAPIYKNNQAFVISLPRVTFTGGAPSAGGKNQDVLLPLTGMVSKDDLTGATLIFNRLEYFEA